MTTAHALVRIAIERQGLDVPEEDLKHLYIAFQHTELVRKQLRVVAATTDEQATHVEMPAPTD